MLSAAAVRDLLGRHAHAVVAEAIRAELANSRAQLARGETLNGDLEVDVLAAASQRGWPTIASPVCRTPSSTPPALFCTPILAGPPSPRPPPSSLSSGAGYLNLELDLDTGKRSSRQDPIRAWICQLTGAASATVVNNNAAATVIALRALCRGKEVVVSRGQLIEIGGSFRIPEIMAVSGAILREVGTTNITRLSDYENAIGPETAALMQIHTSNFRISGFTAAVSTADLVTLGRKHSLPVLDDIGSARCSISPASAPSTRANRWPAPASPPARSGAFFWRQIARRTAGGHPGGAGGVDSENRERSVDACFPLRQDDARRP